MFFNIIWSSYKENCISRANGFTQKKNIYICPTTLVTVSRRILIALEILVLFRTVPICMTLSLIFVHKFLNLSIKLLLQTQN